MKSEKPLKIALISVAEMGHFLPIIHIAEELAQRGHDVGVICNEHGKEKCTKYIEEAGCKSLITADGITREQITPGADHKVNPDAYLGFGMWKPFLKK